MDQIGIIENMQNVNEYPQLNKDSTKLTAGQKLSSERRIFD